MKIARSLLSVTCAALLVSASTTVAFAQGDTAEKPQRRGGERAAQGDTQRTERAERMQAARQARQANPEQRQAMVARMLLRDMELSEEQREAITKLAETNREARQGWFEAHREKMQSVRQELHKAIEAGDDEKAAALREQLRGLANETPPQVDRAAQVREVLTPEQQEVFDQRLAQMQERMEAMRQQRKQAAGQRQQGEGAAQQRPQGRQDGEAQQRGPRGQRGQGAQHPQRSAD